MKLYENHSCDSFSEQKEIEMDPELTTRIRKCTESSHDMMKDTSLQIVDFAQSLEQHILKFGVHMFDPWVLHCLYRASISLSHTAAATPDASYAIGLSICRRVLKLMDVRWKVAGKYRCRTHRPLFLP